MYTLRFTRQAVAAVAAGSLLIVGSVVAANASTAGVPSAATRASVVSTIAVARPAAMLAPSSGNVCATVSPAGRTCDLWARRSAPIVQPGVVAGVTFWSYTSGASDIVGATGPTMVVTEGDQVTLNLHNRLANGQLTSLSLPQVDGLSDDVNGVADGSDKSYNFTAARPGTFLYEAGGVSNGARQTALGMVGALVVLPAVAPGTAYGTAATAYTDESVVLLTDVDLGLHANPLGYDMRNFNPQIHLLNGATFPATTHIPVTAGGTALLRVINGGAVQHAIGVLGTDQQVIAESARLLTHPYGVTAENIPAGDSLDLLVKVPAAGGPLFAVYDASSRLDSSLGTATGVVPFGGALTFLDTNVSTTTFPGPSVSALVVTPQRSAGTTDLTFAATAGTAGDPAVTGLEYVIDNASVATGSGTAVAGGTGAVSGILPFGALTSGSHTLLLRANSSLGWGPFAAASFVVDKSGPTVSSLTLTPAVVGSAVVDVAIGGSASDASAGGSNVSSVSYVIDAGSANALTISPASAVSVAFNGVIPASVVSLLAEGRHSVTATAIDQFGNVGPVGPSIPLIRDLTAPSVSNIAITPSPNSGTQGSAADPTSVEVRASFVDPLVGDGYPAVASGVVSGEAFLGTLGSTGMGFPLFLYPAGSPTQLLGTFPVSEMTKYPNGGNIPVYVHAKDVGGNWGSVVVGSLVINRDVIFTSNFETPTTLAPPWGSVVIASGLTAANGTVGGGRQLVITRVGTFNNSSRAYLVDPSPSAETRYNAAFSFTPTSLTTGANQSTARILTIFSACTGTNASAIAVQYRGYGTARQVRLTVGTAGGATNTAWTSLTTGAGVVDLHLTWTSAAAAAITFKIGAQPLQTLNNLNTSANTIELALLGVSAVGNGTGTVATIGTLQFDNFDSRRITAP